MGSFGSSRRYFCHHWHSLRSVVVTFWTLQCSYIGVISSPRNITSIVCSRAYSWSLNNKGVIKASLQNFFVGVIDRSPVHSPHNAPKQKAFPCHNITMDAQTSGSCTFSTSERGQHLLENILEIIRTGLSFFNNLLIFIISVASLLTRRNYRRYRSRTIRSRTISWHLRIEHPIITHGLQPLPECGNTLIIDSND